MRRLSDPIDKNRESENPEIAADKCADRLSFSFIALFVFLSWVVLSHSSHIDNEKAGMSLPWLDPWLTQLTSHIAILLVVPLIPFLLSRAPLSLAGWVKQIPIYVAGFLAFGSFHIILMDVFRTVSFPLLLGRPYFDNLSDIRIWLYELPKDVYSYLLILSVFVTGRHIEQIRLEAASNKIEARNTGRLMLKSGGRTLFLRSEEIIHAEAASNYLDIETDTGRHLIRMTLTALEGLIAAAGDTHIRVHRSHLVKRDNIRAITPKKDSGLVVALAHGKTVPVGRKYMSPLKSALAFEKTKNVT